MTTYSMLERGIHLAYFDPARGHVPNPGMGMQGYAFSDHMHYAWDQAEWRRTEVTDPNRELPKHVLERMFELPYVDNVYFRADWNRVQREPGKLSLPREWDWMMEQVEARGTRWSFRIMNASRHSPGRDSLPEFLTDKLETLEYRNEYEFGPEFKRYPAYTAEYLKYWRELMELFAERYDAHPGLEYVDVSGFGIWGEGHHYGIHDESGQIFNRYPDGSEDAVATLLDDHRAAFAQTPVAMTLHLLDFAAGHEALADPEVWMRRDSIQPFTSTIEWGAMADRVPGRATIWETIVPSFTTERAPLFHTDRTPQRFLDFTAHYAAIGFNPWDVIMAHDQRVELLRGVRRATRVPDPSIDRLASADRRWAGARGRARERRHRGRARHAHAHRALRGRQHELDRTADRTAVPDGPRPVPAADSRLDARSRLRGGRRAVARAAHPGQAAAGAVGGTALRPRSLPARDSPADAAARRSVHDAHRPVRPHVLMRVRLFVEPQQGARYDDILAAALRAEALGFDAFFRSDHFLRMGTRMSGLPGPTDAWTTLAGLARDTTTIRLGTLVSSATFRPAGILAIQAAQVDDMSGGRVELGLGTGWFEPEHRALGIPFPERRFDDLEEQLEVIEGLWSTPIGESYQYEGRSISMAGSPALPKPRQERLPIIVGGLGERRTPRLAARFADEFNVPFPKVPELAQHLDRGRAACERIDRDPASLTRSVALVGLVAGTEALYERRCQTIGRDPAELRRNAVAGLPGEVRARLREVADAGAEVLYLQVWDLHDLDHLDDLAAFVLEEAVAL